MSHRRVHRADAGGHLRDLNPGEGPATVIGSSQRVAPRFAAFAKGTGIHADDGNDTQLAVAKDRVVATLRDLDRWASSIA